MKKLILTALGLLTMAATAMAQSATRTVLYTLGPNETLSWNEYVSNMRINNNKFAFMIENNAANTYSLVVNGEKLVTAPQIWAYWVNPDSKDKCIYGYSNANKDEYLVIDGHKYGPYEEAVYNMRASEYNWDGTPNLNYQHNRNSFIFKRMGNYYRHDNDGTIIPRSGDDYYSTGLQNEEEPTFSSYTGRYKAFFSKKFRLVEFDGNSYVLPIPMDVQDDKVYIRRCIVTENGECIISIYYYLESKGGFDKDFAIHDNKMEAIGEKEYYDLDAHAVLSTEIHKDRSRPMDQFCSAMRWDDEKNEYGNGLDIVLQDKTKRHTFTAKWDYDYVMVDDRKMGKSAPFNAFYDEVNNAFGWVSLEGKQLVLYSYRL